MIFCSVEQGSMQFYRSLIIVWILNIHVLFIFGTWTTIALAEWDTGSISMLDKKELWTFDSMQSMPRKYKRKGSVRILFVYCSHFLGQKIPKMSISCVDSMIKLKSKSLTTSYFGQPVYWISIPSLSLNSILCCCLLKLTRSQSPSLNSSEAGWKSGKTQGAID